MNQLSTVYNWNCPVTQREVERYLIHFNEGMKNIFLSDTKHIISPQDNRWMTFVRQSSSANIFHHPAWSQLLVDCYNYYPFVIAIFNGDGELHAGLPIMHINSRITGQRWVSLPFSDYCRPLYSNNQAYVQLTNQLVCMYENEMIPKIELRGEYPLHARIQRIFSIRFI